jgi:hypothetical protein
MDIMELQKRIEKKREELNEIAACNSDNLCTQEIIRISHELDELIAAYLEICGPNGNVDS